jgi:hypothetical protein
MRYCRPFQTSLLFNFKRIRVRFDAQSIYSRKNDVLEGKTRVIRDLGYIEGKYVPSMYPRCTLIVFYVPWLISMYPTEKIFLLTCPMSVYDCSLHLGALEY